MRFALLTGLLLFGGAAVSNAQSGKAPTTEPAGAVATAPVIESLPESVAEAPLLSGFVEPSTPDRYFEADFIFWETSGSSDHGNIITTTSTATQSPFFNNAFSLDKPNPTYEMGFRFLWGRAVNDFLSLELGGFWVHPSAHPLLFQAGSSVQSGTVVTDTVSLASNGNESLSAASILYELETYGIEANARTLLYSSDRWKIDGLAGIRNIGHGETYDQEVFLAATGDGIREKFQTYNSFFGPQLGADARYRLFDYVSIRGTAKFGFAANFQNMSVTGPAPGGGRLTGGNNLGHFDQTEYSSIFDFGLGLVCHLTPNIHWHGGYNVIWFSTVLRVDDQVASDIAPSNGNVPAPPMSNDTMFLHGFVTGLEITY